MDCFEDHALRMRADMLFVTTTELIVWDEAKIGGGIVVGRECHFSLAV